MFKDFASITKPSEPKIKDLKKPTQSVKTILEVSETQRLQSLKGD